MRGFRPRIFRQWALLLSWCLVLVSAETAFAYQASAPPSPQAAQQSPDQLQQLVAPIALYPDASVAQILAAAAALQGAPKDKGWVLADDK
jgi:hypothetical protein